MKDKRHHLRHVQRKVVQDVRREERRHPQTSKPEQEETPAEVADTELVGVEERPRKRRYMNRSHLDHH